jgi:hypothetical protein
MPSPRDEPLSPLPGSLVKSTALALATPSAESRAAAAASLASTSSDMTKENAKPGMETSKPPAMVCGMHAGVFAALAYSVVSITITLFNKASAAAPRLSRRGAGV